MFRRALIILAVAALALAAAPALAQGGGQDCEVDPLIPCGPLPWSLPRLPALRSPTPYTPVPTPTANIVSPTPSPTASITPTPSPTPTATLGNYPGMASTAIGGADTAYSTLAPLQNATLVINGGTPVALATSASEIGSYVGTFFGFVQGLTLLNINGTGGAVTFFLLALVFVLLTLVTTAVIPLLASMVRWVVKLVELVANFLPW